MYNGGEEPFRHNIYGDEIIFQRIIYAKLDPNAQARPSTLTIRNRDGTALVTGCKLFFKKWTSKTHIVALSALRRNF